jgi:hypothetical protein
MMGPRTRRVRAIRFTKTRVSLAHVCAIGLVAAGALPLYGVEIRLEALTDRAPDESGHDASGAMAQYTVEDAVGDV